VAFRGEFARGFRVNDGAGDHFVFGGRR